MRGYKKAGTRPVFEGNPDIPLKRYRGVVPEDIINKAFKVFRFSMDNNSCVYAYFVDGVRIKDLPGIKQDHFARLKKVKDWLDAKGYTDMLGL